VRKLLHGAVGAADLTYPADAQVEDFVPCSMQERNRLSDAIFKQDFISWPLSDY
jgi:hypothetical protein